MIVIIDNYDSFTYNLYQSIAPIEPDIKVFRNNKITVKEIAALNPAGIIISPGPGRPEQAGIGVELVKQLASSIPILGICLGHQIITIAFGGQVKLAETPVHGKSTYVFHHRQGIYSDMPLPFVAGRYHSLVAEHDSLPAELIVESENSERLVMGLRHRKYPTFGLQFHPESILTPEGGRLMRNFLEICQ